MFLATFIKKWIRNDKKILTSITLHFSLHKLISVENSYVIANLLRKKILLQPVPGNRVKLCYISYIRNYGITREIGLWFAPHCNDN